jgi:hypothetical protein
MTEYVSIKTSIPEILSAANGLVFKGLDMQEAMSPLIAHITSLENASTWGQDDYASKFLKNYNGDDPKNPVSASIQGLGSGTDSLGASSEAIGNNVVTSMFGYSDTDDSSASGIDATIG